MIDFGGGIFSKLNIQIIFSSINKISTISFLTNLSDNLFIIPTNKYQDTFEQSYNRLGVNSIDCYNKLSNLINKNNIILIIVITKILEFIFY